ncbi:MAG: DinB family protein [Spirochaetia bacterium]|jgi:hypothetical protein
MTKTEYTKFTKGIVDATRGLIAITPDDKLDWRPDASFLKLGAVVHHVSCSVGAGLRDVMDGGWEFKPEGGDEGTGLPPADAFAMVKNIKEALGMIDADWRLFEERFAHVDEATFNTRICKIPWMAPGTTLKEYMLLTTEHLSNHRMQLFIYLRLLGMKINTAHLYGSG